jgi:hypothetical protein
MNMRMPRFWPMGNAKARKRFLGQDGSFEDQFENQFSNKPAWENRAGWDLASFL